LGMGPDRGHSPPARSAAPISFRRDGDVTTNLGLTKSPARGGFEDALQTKDGGCYIRWCFADPDIAEAFAAKFAKDIVPLKTPTKVIYAARWSDDLLRPDGTKSR
jgi:hypothetical protein